MTVCWTCEATFCDDPDCQAEDGLTLQAGDEQVPVCRDCYDAYAREGVWGVDVAWLRARIADLRAADARLDALNYVGRHWVAAYAADAACIADALETLLDQRPADADAEAAP